jgi:Fe2+ transport system protein FeoA
MLGLRLQTRANTAQTDCVRSLADVAAGTTVVLGAPHVDAQLCRRLSQLGLRPGMRVTVGRNTSGGGRIIHSGATRYAIDGSTLRHMSIAA